MNPFILETIQQGGPSRFSIADKFKYYEKGSDYLICGDFSCKEDAQIWFHCIHHHDWQTLMNWAHDEFNGDYCEAAKVYFTAKAIFAFAGKTVDFCIQNLEGDVAVFGGWNRVLYRTGSKKWTVSRHHASSDKVHSEFINAIGVISIITK